MNCVLGRSGDSIGAMSAQPIPLSPAARGTRQGAVRGWGRHAAAPQQQGAVQVEERPAGSASAHNKTAQAGWAAVASAGVIAAAVAEARTPAWMRRQHG